MKKIKTWDKVQVIAGSYKGSVSDVEKVEGDMVYLRWINVRKKAIKKQWFKEVTKPLHISNVMYYSEKEWKPIKVGVQESEWKRYRVNRKTGEKL